MLIDLVIEGCARAGRWPGVSMHVSVIQRFVVRTSSVLFVLTLSACHQLAPASAVDWFIKSNAMCYHVYVIMHVKDP